MRVSVLTASCEQMRAHMAREKPGDAGAEKAPCGQRSSPWVASTVQQTDSRDKDERLLLWSTSRSSWSRLQLTELVGLGHLRMICSGLWRHRSIGESSLLHPSAPRHWPVSATRCFVGRRCPRSRVTCRRLRTRAGARQPQLAAPTSPSGASPRLAAGAAGIPDRRSVGHFAPLKLAGPRRPLGVCHRPSVGRPALAAS